MNRKLVIVFGATFLAGALLVLLLRAPDSKHAQHQDHSEQGAEPATVPATTPAPAKTPTPADHAGHTASPAGGHAGHAAGAQDVTLWVCESHPETGANWEGTCPLDGKPRVKRTVKAQDLVHVGNASCPICKMKATGELMGVHKGQVVHLGCAGCDDTFIEDPQAAVDAARKATN